MNARAWGMLAFLLIAAPRVFAADEEGQDARQVSPGTYIDVEEDRVIQQQTTSRLMVEPNKFVDLEAGGGVVKVGDVLQVESDDKYFKRHLDKMSKEITALRDELAAVKKQIDTLQKAYEDEIKKPKILSA